MVEEIFLFMWANDMGQFRNNIYRTPILKAFRLWKLDPTEQKDWAFSIKAKKAVLQKKSSRLTSFLSDLSILERQQNNRKRTILKELVGVIYYEGKAAELKEQVQLTRKRCSFYVSNVLR